MPHVTDYLLSVVTKFLSFFSSEHSGIFKSPFSFLVNMPDSPSSLLPPLRRVVTTHDSNGLATVESNVVLEPEVSLIDQFRSGCLDVASKRMEGIQGAQSAAFWVTTDGFPVNDNNIWSVCSRV